MKHLDDVTIVI